MDLTMIKDLTEIIATALVLIAVCPMVIYFLHDLHKREVEDLKDEVAHLKTLLAIEEDHNKYLKEWLDLNDEHVKCLEYTLTATYKHNQFLDSLIKKDTHF